MSDAVIQTRLAKVVHVVDPDTTYAPIEAVINRGIEEEFASEVTIPFDHVRLGDQAKPI